MDKSSFKVVTLVDFRCQLFLLRHFLCVGPLNEPAELQGGRVDYSTEANNTRRPNDAR